MVLSILEIHEPAAVYVVEKTSVNVDVLLVSLNGVHSLTAQSSRLFCNHQRGRSHVQMPQADVQQGDGARSADARRAVDDHWALASGRLVELENPVAEVDAGFSFGGYSSIGPRLPYHLRHRPTVLVIGVVGLFVVVVVVVTVDQLHVEGVDEQCVVWFVKELTTLKMIGVVVRCRNLKLKN